MLRHLTRALLAATMTVITHAGVTQADDGPSLQPEAALRAFELARRLSDRDAGATWGKSLYGPMLLVDPATRRVMANQADAEGRLSATDGVYVGEMPESVGIANTATEWSGRRWTMLMWPLPADEAARGTLLMHELFHRIQDELGFPAASPANSHLDGADGRTLLRLEWRALAAALGGAGDRRREAIGDALVFRARRHALFPDGAREELDLERNEGLAEYTGQRLCGPASEFARRAAENLRARAGNPYLARGFAYASGPAYGALLDELDPQWREAIRAGGQAGDGRRAVDLDLGVLLARAIGFPLPADLARASELRMMRYDGEQLAQEERERESARQARLAEYRRRFVESPALRLPLSGEVSYTFNPNGMEAFDEHASYFGWLRVVDEWGILESSGGALLVRSEGRLSEAVVAGPVDPAAADLRGEGWTLKLTPGWAVVPAESTGWTVRPSRE